MAGRDDEILTSTRPRYARRPQHACRVCVPVGKILVQDDESEHASAVAPDSEVAHSASARQERLRLRFIQQAPFLPSASDLGITSCPVQPWPHQLRVVRQVTSRFPESFLFADEVGLGKTIEAGLALRQLLISGRVQRVLILVPKGLLRQWQEELHEKMVLDIPRFDGERAVDVLGSTVPPAFTDPNPWNRWPILLASSQLARQTRRRQQLLSAQPWDLIVVDEAHHARRRGAGSGPPNRFLQLLAGHGRTPGLKDKCRCLYLLTATPMQVHATELWDLLRLLGLGGRWGASEEAFLRFFEELRRPFEERDWPWLFTMHGESIGELGRLDGAYAHWARERLGEEAERLETLLLGGSGMEDGPRRTHLQGLSKEQRQALDRGLRRHTPLRALAWRHTRGLLRAYRRAGWVDAAVPRRRTNNVWIPLRPAERDLYDRIEAFVSEFFRRYEARRRGLGFAMTLYRRRLTSSFYAIRRSLERRLRVIEQRDSAATDDGSDLIDGADGPDASDSMAMPTGRTASLFDEGGEGISFEDERVFLDDFLQRLDALPRDSKLERLLEDLGGILKQRDRVLVFTQYIDTLDFLRQALRQQTAWHVACYSGRGGEVWRDGEGWQACSKDDLKERFRCGEFHVLLCTEAAGEGLNLQTCGVMIHFDMPWNPMRVEQRIGRIDRIGQSFETIWIFNYFYADTVEAEIHRRLSHRIQGFEEVVGTLQPILQDVAASIRQLAMLPADRRQRPLEDVVRQWDQDLERLAQRSPDILGDAAETFAADQDLDADDLDARLPEMDRRPLHTPVPWQQIEQAFVTSQHFKGCFEAVPEVPASEVRGTWNLVWGGGHGRRPETRRVTFDPAAFERSPYGLILLTYGQPLFEALLQDVEDDSDLDLPQGMGLYQTSEPAPVSLFLAPTAGKVLAVESLTDLDAALAQAPGRWRPDDEGRASSRFSRRRLDVLGQQTAVEQRRRRSRRSVLVESARHVLWQAAHVEQARARRPGLFDHQIPQHVGPRAVESLARHGHPLAALLRLISQDEVPSPDPKDSLARRLDRRSAVSLERQWDGLLGEAESLHLEVESLEQRMAQAERTVREPSAGGLLDRRWFAVTPPEDVVTTVEAGLASEGVEPFVDAVPFYDDVRSLVEDLRDEEGQLQQNARERPGDYRWMILEGRHAPRPGLCVAQVTSKAMGGRVPQGSLCLFRLRPRGPWDGKVVLLEHPDIDDIELGGSLTLRRYESRHRRPTGSEAEDAYWTPDVVLHAEPENGGWEPQILQDIEPSSLWVLAELLEIL